MALVSYDEAGCLQSVTSVPELPVANPKIGAFPDGTFVVVGARCEWSPQGPELNALAIDQTGRIVRRGCVGDGVHRLQVSSDGAIWVSYFDEGIYGAFGWNYPGPAPLGAGGLVKWSPEFEKVWAPDPSEGLIYESYGPNIADDEVWCCTYPDSQVVRIAQHERTIFATSGLAGPSALLTNGDTAVLISAKGDPSLLVQGRFVNGCFTETGRSRLHMPDGRLLTARLLACRGPVAYFMQGLEWFSFDLTSLSSS
ncbi:MAG: hypothetical protein Q4F65_04490 [Propionibacteriaceae bacterium]|nr:hypothetical protein [Propionibacteriaceae bacterium]